ncbi:MAG: hypothetical protein ACIAQF_12035 [Phycisphaerales bacterium JB065]
MARGFVRHEVDVARLKAQRTGYRWIAAGSVAVMAVASLVFLLLSLAFALTSPLGESGAFAVSGAIGLIVTGISLAVLCRYNR